MGVLRRSMFIWPEEKRLDNVHHKWCLIWDLREGFILLEKMSGHWAEEAWVSPDTEDVVGEVGVRLRTEGFCESLTDPRAPKALSTLDSQNESGHQGIFFPRQRLEQSSLEKLNPTYRRRQSLQWLLAAWLSKKVSQSHLPILSLLRNLEISKCI